MASFTEMDLSDNSSFQNQPPSAEDNGSFQNQPPSVSALAKKRRSRPERKQPRTSEDEQDSC